MTTQHFSATTELENIRRQKSTRRRKTYQHSRLTKYRHELVSLRKAGGSYRELALWLRQNKRIKVIHTTIMRYLEKLPEIKESSHA